MDPRIREIRNERMDDLRRSTDRMFAVLMLIQWIGAVVMAMIVSPQTWIGTSGKTHIHIWAALILGGILSSFPIFLAIYYPGRVMTRHVIAFAQMLWSALLIHLTGGRIETHFHVFGSLAFLAFYRDWRVLITATVVVAVDHWARGTWWPQSVFGIFLTSPYRWIEHAAWVAFEDVFLILSCLRGGREMNQIAERQATLEVEVAQRKVAERELQAANETLAQRNEEIEQFTYAVSHDLKSPIVTCTGFLGLAGDDLDSGHIDEAKESLERVRRTLTRMADSINDLLQLSRIGRIPLEPEILDTATLVNSIISDLKPRAAARGAQLVQEGDFPRIRADRKRVVEVFENLVTNALKYGCPHPGMQVTIGAIPAGDATHFFVRDEGPGIPADQHKKVFALFHRLDKKEEGSGVGLAIVEKIMAAHHGRVWIEQSSEIGTEFRFVFPDEVGPAPQTPELEMTIAA